MTESGQDQDLDLGESKKNENCLIDLELEEKPDNSLDSYAKDDTFTQLANRTNGQVLPTPDEVISLCAAR